jgi:hypothetical protein
MSFTKTLFNKSVFFLALIPLFAVWGFWVTYFTRPQETISVYEHLHGVAMFGWVLLLVLQSFLVRTHRRPLHRRTGQLAYVLGPLIIVSTVVLANYRLNMRGLTAEGMYVLGLQTFILIQYTVFLAMALRHRKQPDVHSRWMICTAFAMLDPIFARILLVNFIPVPLESGLIQYITYAFTDLIVLALVLKDWKGENRHDVFLPALLLLLATQLPTLVLLEIPAWAAFAEWFMKLPLS